MKTLDEVINSTTPQVRELVDQILKIEREYQNYRDFSRQKDKEAELCDRLVKLIEREIRQ